MKKPPKNVIQLTKPPLKHYLKTLYKMISKPHFFTVILMNLILVLNWLRDGKWGNTKYRGLPGSCLTLTCITGNDFKNVSPVMGCLQVLCVHLDIFRVI